METREKMVNALIDIVLVAKSTHNYGLIEIAFKLCHEYNLCYKTDTEIFMEEEYYPETEFIVIDGNIIDITVSFDTEGE